MTPTKNQERAAAFSKWLAAIGGLDAAHNLTGISTRSLQRMRHPNRPPTPQLLDRCASWADSEGLDKLAIRLRDAAQPDTGRPSDA